MVTDSRQNTSDPSIRGADTRPAARSDFARLGRRISDFTSKGLMTAVVLIAGAGFGRQVLIWWGADAQQPDTVETVLPLNAEWGDPFQTHVLRFADQPWSMRTRSIVGNEQAAADALRADCRELIEDARAAGDQPEPAELKLLNRLAASEPAEQGPTGWRLYQHGKLLPMVAGTKPIDSLGKSNTDPDLAEASQRMVVWGLAVPSGTGTWNLHTFHPAFESERMLPELPDVPLPPGGRSTLSVRVADGGGIAAFVGRCEPRAWRHFYDEWFNQQGWQPTGDWRSSETAWHVRYAAGEDMAAGTVDVTFAVTPDDELTGLLVTTPAAVMKEK